MKRFVGLLILGFAGALLLAAPFRREDVSEKFPPIDFSRSFVTFVTRGRGNNARIQVESRCVLTDKDKGTTEEYFLLASCKSEDTYGRGDLFTNPNYDFSAIFSRKDYRLIRQHASASDNNPTAGVIADFFDDVVFHIQPARRVQVLPRNAAIIKATLQNRMLIGRSELTLKNGSLHAVIDYPVKTINVNDSRGLFQVDTGPLLYPNPDLPHTRPVELFEHAFVAYKTFDRAEFIALAPTFILAAAKNPADKERFLPWKSLLSVNHYSATRKLAARNTLMAIP